MNFISPLVPLPNPLSLSLSLSLSFHLSSVPPLHPLQILFQFGFFNYFFPPSVALSAASPSFSPPDTSGPALYSRVSSSSFSSYCSPSRPINGGGERRRLTAEAREPRFAPSTRLSAAFVSAMMQRHRHAAIAWTATHDASTARRSTPPLYSDQSGRGSCKRPWLPFRTQLHKSAHLNGCH